MTVSTSALDQLRRSFRGDVITAGDGSYDDARRLWNGIHDRRPAVILRPSDAAEVATAISFGREHDLEIQVRSGGHAKAGLRGRDGGVVIDMTAMRGVEVDPDARIARVNGGTLLGELDVAAQGHGLVTPVGVVGHTGVAGLTLGGGVGRLQRHFGLTIDNLAAVELVTADGRLVRASETEEPELFWGLRGAGWNFGVATAFEFRLHPFGPDLHRGVLIYPATQAHDVWEVFHAYAASAPDAVAVILNVDRAGEGAGYPDELVGKPIVAIAYNHSGAPEDVERDTAGLHAGPAPIATTIGSQPYLEVQTAHDLLLGWGGRSFIRGCNGNDLRPEALDELVDLVAAAPGESSFSDHGPRRGDRSRPRGRDGLRRSVGRLRPQRRHLLDGPGARRRQHGLVPPGDEHRRARCGPRLLRERLRRRRPRRDPRDLRRREARPPVGAQASVGPGQRVPRQPQRRPRLSHDDLSGSLRRLRARTGPATGTAPRSGRGRRL